MVGRLKDDKSLAINGTGTAPEWKEALEKSNVYSFKLVLSESGVGPSDHTSFYNIGVPAIHLFTGQHEDYHKPSDDADKLNYEGMQAISDYVFDIVSSLNQKGKLSFQRTKDESANTAADFKVTLGVIPDYLFSEKGMRIDGTREGRPAANAGMKQGDIILKIGDIEVTDMMSYMGALGKFEKGQKTPVTFKRGEEIMVVEVTW
jgi:C-terminal processing protease CtpA/Prc